MGRASRINTWTLKAGFFSGQILREGGYALGCECASDGSRWPPLVFTYLVDLHFKCANLREVRCPNKRTSKTANTQTGKEKTDKQQSTSKKAGN